MKRAEEATTGVGRVDRSLMDGAAELRLAPENTLLGKMQRMEVGDVLVIPSWRLGYARVKRSDLRTGLGMDFAFDIDPLEGELTITRTA